MPKFSISHKRQNTALWLANWIIAVIADVAVWEVYTNTNGKIVSARTFRSIWNESEICFYV